MDVDKIKNILGCDFKVEPLKPESRVKQNMGRSSDIRQLTVDKIIAEDGRKYKIHESENPENINMKRISKMIPHFSKIEYVPDIIHSDDHYIILDYVDGSFPSLTDDHFVRQYAKNLAHLHELNTESFPVDNYIEELSGNLQYLASKRKLSKKLVVSLAKKIEEIAPESIKKGMVYADLTAQNFVQTENDQLYFIDLGSFQEGIYTDMFLLASTLYAGFDKKAFKDSYLSSGGNSYIFDNNDFLLLSSSITRGAQMEASVKTISLFDWRKRRSRKKAVIRLMKQLESYVA